MFSSLLRPKRARRTHRSRDSYFGRPSPSPYRPHDDAYRSQVDDDEDDEDGDGFREEGLADEESASGEDGDDDADMNEAAPLLPIFSAAHLGSSNAQSPTDSEDRV